MESTKTGRGNLHDEKIFIVANVLNEDLIRTSWGDDLVELIDILGKDNVFISIYENDAGNGTETALLDLGWRLPRKFEITPEYVN